MLPITPLPNSFLALGDLTGRTRRGGQATRKLALDEAPSFREVGVAGRQRPDCMQVVGQNANRDGLERTALLGSAIDCTQAVNIPDPQAIEAAIN